MSSSNVPQILINAAALDDIIEAGNKGGDFSIVDSDGNLIDDEADVHIDDADVRPDAGQVDELIDQLNKDGGADAQQIDEFEVPKEPVGSIDKDISPEDLLIMIKAEIDRKTIAGHHIQSMNHFYMSGIKQIVTRIFEVNTRFKNERNATDEDKEIEEISIRIEFTDISVEKPLTIKDKSGHGTILMPNAARRQMCNYSGAIKISLNATATAYMRNKTQKTVTATIKDYRIASIPIMVGSCVCHLHNANAQMLKDMEEDPYDPFAYFILNGTEWCVDNLENITNNMLHAHRNMHKNEIARGAFLSKPGDALENSFQIILRYLNNGGITIELQTNKKVTFTVPFFLLFKAMGGLSDKQIADMIVNGIDNTDSVTVAMLNILERAWFAKYGAQYSDQLLRENDMSVIIYELSKINDPDIKPDLLENDINLKKHVINKFLTYLDTHLLVHLGNDANSRMKKLMFLGYLINKLLRVEMRITESTDRDSLKNKRIHSAGTSLAKAFKTSFSLTVVKELKTKLTKAFKDNTFSSVKLEDVIKTGFNTKDLERTMVQSITSGNKTITIKRSEVVNRVSSQQLYRKNDMNVKSTLNTVNTSNSSASKQNERADIMRRVHASYIGYIDISQSADTGEKVGISKQLACMASVSLASLSFEVKKLLSRDPEVIPIDIVKPADISYRNLARVFVNGDWIGCCENAFRLAAKYRAMRRHSKLHYSTTISCELMSMELNFWTDVGRLLRPLIIVYNNFDEYVADRRAGSKAVQFKQWIKLTKDHLLDLAAGIITIDDLREQQVVEYISPDEQENMFIAANLDLLRELQGDVTKRFTHVEIEQSIFGIVTLASHMANHSSAARNTMFTNHRKQSAGWYALNWPYRMVKNEFLQDYNEIGMVKTFSDALGYSNVQNATIALACYGGNNQEDSTSINKSSVDCGMFNGSHFTTEMTKLERNEQFVLIDPNVTMDIKKDANYDKLVNGIIAIGAIVTKNDVLVSKVLKLDKPIEQYNFRDKSLVYKHDEPAYVDDVVSGFNEEGDKFIRIKLRITRHLIIGDKLSSRTGNKGIVCELVHRYDMPFLENGVIPDIIVNAHSIPSRMAINQLIEGIIGWCGSIEGTINDCTAFRRYDVPDILARLEKHGYKFGGLSRMYNGRLGVFINSLIFCSINGYQRPLKFARDGVYSSRRGPTTALERQPVEGRANDGGLRNGEMEKDVLVAQGPMIAFDEKFYEDSDGYDIHICALCKYRCAVNEKKRIFKCNRCGDNAQIHRVRSSWVANLSFNEYSAMGIDVKFNLDKEIIQVAEE